MRTEGERQVPTEGGSGGPPAAGGDETRPAGGGQPPAAGEGQSVSELREQLRLVEEDLSSVRESLAGLRRAIGARDEGTGDQAELAAAITAVEEQEALAGVLERRRAELLSRPGVR